MSKEEAGLHAPFYEFGGAKGRMIKRLGAALVFRWDEIPAPVQEMLLTQAGLIGGLGEGFDDDTTADGFKRFLKGAMRRATQEGRG